MGGCSWDIASVPTEESAEGGGVERLSVETKTATYSVVSITVTVSANPAVHR